MDLNGVPKDRIYSTLLLDVGDISYDGEIVDGGTNYKHFFLLIKKYTHNDYFKALYLGKIVGATDKYLLVRHKHNTNNKNDLKRYITIIYLTYGVNIEKDVYFKEEISRKSSGMD